MLRTSSSKLDPTIQFQSRIVHFVGSIGAAAEPVLLVGQLSHTAVLAKCPTGELVRKMSCGNVPDHSAERSTIRDRCHDSRTHRRDVMTRELPALSPGVEEIPPNIPISHAEITFSSVRI